MDEFEDFKTSNNFKRLTNQSDRWFLKGPCRVARLCLLTILLPTALIAVPLYLKYVIYSEEIYALGMSDMRLLDSKISTTWCQSQRIQSNATFNAYVLADRPATKPHTQNVSLMRDMILEDDMKEYWGFYLLKGSVATVSVCTRRAGSSLIVIRGQKHLHECAYFGDVSSEEEEEINEIEPVNVSVPNEMKRARPGVVFHGDVEFHDRYLLSEEHDASHVEDKNYRLLKNDVPGLPKREPANSNEIRKSIWDSLKKYKESGKSVLSLEKSGSNDIVQWLKTALLHNTTAAYNSQNKSKISKREIKLWAPLKDHLYVNDEENNVAAEEGLVDDEVTGKFDDRTDNDTSNSEFWSSFSSSEEQLLECKGLILNLPLTASQHCNKSLPTKVVENACRTQTISYKVPADGYYFFVFSSENEVQTTFIRTYFHLEKVIYNVSQPVAACENSTGQCSLPLNFFSTQKLVLELPVNESLWNNEYLVISSCEPRTFLYAVCVLAVPILIILCGF